MSNAVVEVVLGLVFVFFLFSLLCSGLNELIANMLGKRADFLAAGVWSLLDTSLDDGTATGTGTRTETEAALALRQKVYRDFWAHPLIRQPGQRIPEPHRDGAVRNAWKGVCGRARRFFTTKYLYAVLPPAADLRSFEAGRLRPSYVPPQTFATVLRDVVRQNDVPEDSSMGKCLRALFGEAGHDPKAVDGVIARWYDAQMERVSGWCKRESKRVLALLALIVVVALNVDTVVLARTLWTNPTLREAVAEAADRQIQAAATSTTVAGGEGAAAAPVPVVDCPVAEDDSDEPAEGAPTTTSVPPDPKRIASDAHDCIRSLSLPLGWSEWPFAATWKEWLLRLLGWALTIGALTFGAPFWFDLLNRFGSLRAAGVKPKSTTGTGPA